jgi:hypothetical protein
MHHPWTFDIVTLAKTWLLARTKAPKTIHSHGASACKARQVIMANIAAATSTTFRWIEIKLERLLSICRVYGLLAFCWTGWHSNHRNVLKKTDWEFKIQIRRYVDKHIQDYCKNALFHNADQLPYRAHAVMRSVCCNLHRESLMTPSHCDLKVMACASRD